MSATGYDLTKTARDLRERLIIAGGAGVGGLILLALTRALIQQRPSMAERHNIWLVLHLVSVIPTVPLGAYVLLRRKGDWLHRTLGRCWAVLMMSAALSSFGLHEPTGGLSWIHIFSIVVVVTVPLAIIQAIRGNIRVHRRMMTLSYLGLITAGLFTLLPARLLGSWLFG